MLALAPLALAGCSNKKFEVVPLQVNVLKGVSISQENVNEIVAKANEILEQEVQIRFDFGKEQSTTRDFNDEVDNNDQISSREKDFLFRHCTKLVNAKFGRKGFAMVIANRLPDDDLGLARLDNDYPVAFMKNAGTTTEMGSVLAHEFGHVFGMWKQHKIDETTVADDAAHHPTDKSNLMWTFPTLATGHKLTADQRQSVKIRSQKRTAEKAQFELSALTPLERKHAPWTDLAGDVGQGHLDLVVGSLFAADPEGDLEVDISLAGLHPTEAVNSRFEVFANTDDDAGSGGTFGSFQGIDKVLRVTLSGEFPFTDPAGRVTSELLDIGSGTMTLLDPGGVERIAEIADRKSPSLPSAVDVLDAVHQAVPFSLLGSLADSVPIGIRAIDLDTGELDEVSFDFPFRPPPGPSLEMSPLRGRPGDTIHLTGENFHPSSRVTVLLGEDEILRTETQSSGSFSASFVFPELAPGDHFVTARDETGAFDFSVLHASLLTGVTGSANRVGTVPPPGKDAGAQVGFVGKLTFTESVNLTTVTVTIQTLLDEEGGAGELFAGLPITLTARPGSTRTSAIFENSSRAIPKVRLDVNDRGQGVLDLHLRVDRGTIPVFPRLCAGAPRLTTNLTSTATIRDGVNPPLVGITTQSWRCLDLVGGDPRKPRSLRVP